MELPVCRGRQVLGIGLEAATSIGVALAFFLAFLAALNVIFPSTLGIGGPAGPGAFLSALRQELDRKGGADSPAASGRPPLLDAALTVLSHEVKTRPAGAIAWTTATGEPLDRFTITLWTTVENTASVLAAGGAARRVSLHREP